MTPVTPSAASWAILILGILLFVSPWIFGFSAMAEETGNATIEGVLIAGSAGLALATHGRFPEGWVNFVLLTILFGAGALVSAQIFGFANAAVWVEELIGLAVIILSMIEMWRVTGPSVTTA